MLSTVRKKVITSGIKQIGHTAVSCEKVRNAAAVVDISNLLIRRCNGELHSE